MNLNNTKVNALVIELNLATSKLDTITNELKDINALVDGLKAKIAKQENALEGERKKFNTLDKGLNQARTSEYLDWKAVGLSKH